MVPSPSSAENSLDPSSPLTNAVHVFPQPRVRIVGFKLPGPLHDVGFEVPGLSSGKKVVLAFLRQPGLCTRGPAGMPVPIDLIERLRPNYAKSPITEALCPYSTPDPPYSGTLWPQHQGLQICKTWAIAYEARESHFNLQNRSC